MTQTRLGYKCILYGFVALLVPSIVYRGMDDVARVVFLGIPRQKVERLVSSSLTELSPNTPLDVSTVLRGCLQAAGRAGSDPTILASLARVVLEPFAACKDPRVKEQTVHQFLYAVRYLKEAGLLDARGGPSNVSFLTAHVSYHGAGIFLFTKLLTDGWLDELASLPLPKGVVEGMLLHIIALIFNRLT